MGKPIMALRLKAYRPHRPITMAQRVVSFISNKHAQFYLQRRPSQQNCQRNVAEQVERNDLADADALSSRQPSSMLHVFLNLTAGRRPMPGPALFRLLPSAAAAPRARNPNATLPQFPADGSPFPILAPFDARHWPFLDTPCVGGAKKSSEPIPCTQPQIREIALTPYPNFP
jgi:hypothetical protein